jgi:hypothetical protein
MPLIPKLIPNTAVLQRIATLPLTTYQAGETVFAAGTKTGRLLILRKGAVTIEKEGIEIAKVTEPGAVSRRARRVARRRSRHTLVRYGNPGPASQPRK